MVTPEVTYAVEGEWLVEQTNSCTCDPHYGAHQTYCGTEPIAKMEEVMKVLREHNAEKDKQRQRPQVSERCMIGRKTSPSHPDDFAPDF